LNCYPSKYYTPSFDRIEIGDVGDWELFIALIPEICKKGDQKLILK